MNNTDIKSALSELAEISYLLETEYEENGGEITESTEQKEQQLEDLQILLSTEGVNSLGRWLKGVEDEIKNLKAEKDFVSRRIKAKENTIDYIKSMVFQVCQATGTEKIKGSLGYTFTPYVSEKTETNKDLLKSSYFDKVNNAIREAGVPSYITFTLGASTTEAKISGVMDGDEALFVTTQTPSCKFTKPRATKATEE